MFELRDVAVRLGRRPILSGIRLALKPGSLTVLVGPNGAGKSTLLKVLTGELPPYSGAALLEGTPLAALSPADLAARRAVLPQSCALAFPFTVLEVVRLGLDARRDLGAAERQGAPSQALARVDLAGFGARAFQDLSGGEQQRVHLARILCQVSEPVAGGRARALLLDEPTSSLDIRHQAGVLRIARDFADRGGLVFAILHDLNLAGAFADRLVVLDAGRIVADGPPASVLPDPLLERVFGIGLDLHESRDRPPYLVPRYGDAGHAQGPR